MQDEQFLLEKRLMKLNPALSRKYRDCVAVMSIALNRYESNFPKYSDHSMRHSLDVIEWCNRIVGHQNIELMNSEEIFCLLMAIYLHDFGMGIAESDYHKIMPQISKEKYEEYKDYKNAMPAIRSVHNELSAMLIKKYAPLFEIDDEKYIYAISQIAKGHRVVDLLDEEKYPMEYEVTSGEKICLPYLAALIRLADEIDIEKGRNEIAKYDRLTQLTGTDYEAWSKADAVDHVDVTDDSFEVYLNEVDDEVYSYLMKEKAKIVKTLDQCVEAVNGRTKFTIYQTKLNYHKK